MWRGSSAARRGATSSLVLPGGGCRFGAVINLSMTVGVQEGKMPQCTCNVP